ncbi:MAG: peptidoglycan -binding protein [Gemmobacter sp.]
MALSRRAASRMSGSIWPGFVDAMTALLLVLMFVLSIFMIVQTALRDTITAQDSQLDALAEQVAGLADALGLERTRAARAEAEAGRLSGALSAAQEEGAAQAALIAALTARLTEREGELAAAGNRIADFERQVLALIAERDSARDEGARLAGELDGLEAERTRLMTEAEAMQLALAAARTEIDAAAEEARLAAARREALEALVADLRRDAAERRASLADLAARLAATEQAAESRIGALEAELSETERARLAELAAAEALRARLAEAEAELSAEEAARLAEAAAADALRQRLENAQAELTAMTLALEEQRRRAEETLTLLAGAQAAQADLDARLAAALVARRTTEEELARLRAEGADRDAVRAELASALAAQFAAEGRAADALTLAEQRARLLATAEARLAEEQGRSTEAARQVALLNEQVAVLRAELGRLQAILDASAERDAEARIQIEALGSQLNAALARVASEERRRADAEAARAEAEAARAALEEAERRRLEQEAQQLERFRSEFFGQLRDVLAGREGVRIVGDRFVFSSEVLFQPGAADLAPEGQAQIARVAAILSEIADDIPPGIDWILRVDGHTDNVPLSGLGQFRDNWELSQARALSVVRYMQDVLGFPPERMAATGFGEYRPVAAGDSPEARAQNRRIELKLTER